MPQNNPALFTAVIAGATGGSINDRWITSASPSDLGTTSEPEAGDFSFHVIGQP
jgi:hypothetical protein